MHGDFSRLVLDPDTFSRVLMQQGRVMVDSDWNDQAAVFLRSQRLLAADLIGPHGGPREPGPGFEIAKAPANGSADLTIGAGTYYVDGIRCVVTSPMAGGPPMRYSHQPFRPAAQEALPKPPFLVYLDVWERHVTALEAPEIREVALGGPDTTTRTEVVWQVRAQSLAGNVWGKLNTACAAFRLDEFRSLLAGTRPLMKAGTRDPDDVRDDPCLSSPDARYRRQENQLYRVEIHEVQPDGTATFVWSRENGSVVVPWLATEDGDLRVTGIRDKVRGFSAGDWVELTDDGLELSGQAGPLVRLARVDGELLTVDRTTASGPISSNPAALPNAKVRRWEQRDREGEPLSGGAVRLVTGTGADHWIELEDGIRVQFQPPAALPGPAAPPPGFRVGDYWAFPARVATGDIVWPLDPDEKPLALPPNGVEHHYAPLAVIPGGRAAGGAPVDLRHQFGPLSTCVRP